MGQKTNISWCSWTLNAIYGCREVSAGCQNCYAVTLSHRYGLAGKASGKPNVFDGLTARDEAGQPHWSGAITFVPERLEEPIRKARPQRIFVNSLSDLFYARVSREIVDQHWAAFALAPQHQFLTLTKRPERMARYLLDPEQPGRVALQVKAMIEDAQQQGKNWAKAKHLAARGLTHWDITQRLTPGPFGVTSFPNVWLGTSVESQEVIGRVDDLLSCPAAVRFLSVEPLIGPVDLSHYLPTDYRTPDCISGCSSGTDGRFHHHPYCRRYGGSPARNSPLHWVIVGGESGPGHRPMDLDWARKVRDDCARANIPYFFKQTGGPKPGTGTTLDGIEHHAFPVELPQIAA